jgi:hypothetical protein
MIIRKFSFETDIEYGAVCWGDSHREDLVCVLNGVQKRAAKFANNMNESV